MLQGTDQGSRPRDGNAHSRLWRRTLLQNLVSGFALSACGGLGPVPTPVLTGSGSTTLDGHCHIFNARDLPIVGFLEKVVLAERPALYALAPLIKLLAIMMDAQAPGARQEAEDLRAGRSGPPMAFRSRGGAPAAPRPLAAGPPPLSDDELMRGLIVNAVRRLQAPDAAALSIDGRVRRIAPQSRPLGLDPQDAELLRALAARAPGQDDLRLPTRPERFAAPLMRQVTPEEVAAGVLARQDDTYGIFYLAALLTRPREELARRLAGLPASDDGDVSIFTPALVDFSYWLDDHNVSTLADQIDVMGEIAALKRPYGVHAYVSFCPWRQIVEPGQMQLVKDAILRRGFIGVKLYPVMGFRPIGNDGAADASAYPRPLRGRLRELDRALGDLYQWCADNGVPIMAHCSFSQYPSNPAGERGGPRNWAPVLTRWPNLRLNLGHSGGLWHLLDDDTRHDWTRQLVPMLKDHPTLHADFSDYSLILARNPGEAEENARTLTALKQLLDATPEARSRLIYGTDWLMLARDVGAEAYYPNMKRTLGAAIGLNDQEMAGYLGFNAARFLGLSKGSDGSMPPTRQRLEAFYSDHQLDRTILARWDQA